MTAKNSSTFMGNMQGIHRTGATTDDAALHAWNEQIVRVNGAEDLLPCVFGDEA